MMDNRNKPDDLLVLFLGIITGLRIISGCSTMNDKQIQFTTAGTSLPLQLFSSLEHITAV
jgi:hypothetical protein